MAPNQPGRTARTVRVDDDLWAAVTTVADARGESVSDVVRRALRRYVNRYPDLREGGQA